MSVRERELVAAAEDAGILLAGPNGQGLVSTPARLCAQIVGPYPPAGRIGLASQSGNLVLGVDEHGRGEWSRDQPRHIGRERRDGVRR